ncbi:MAG: ABC transporter permease [Pseudorhodoplanes sp.]|jgi:peptide/nickel transport system permease protein|nr:ABC transporter permease [Pseudorhodoplanes sp.]
MKADVTSVSHRSSARAKWRSVIRANPLCIPALLILLAMIGVSLLAPLISSHDPVALAPSLRLQPPGDAFLLGTDLYGRDLLARILYGGRVSLLIGFGAAVVGLACGLVLGLIAGYFRGLDSVIMRAMDGVMAIPNVLLAIAIVTLWGAHLAAVLLAITIPEIPRVTRLVRSVMLSAREELYVKAAIALGAPSFTILRRHLLPNALGPLLVQGTYICASAILLESILSFLGAGINPEVPTWGNIMADARLYFQIRPSMILWPALLLSLVILAINILADTARDWLDPRARKAL